jgi:hypothetical protein
MTHASYSQFRTFDECPRRYWHTYASPEPRRPLPTDDMIAGSARHAEIAADIEHEAFDALPQGWGERVKERKAQGWTIVAELEATLPTPFAPVKCVIDLAMISPDGFDADIIDWKANRIPDDDQQLLVYACALAAQYPQLQRVRAAFALTERAGFRRFYYEADDLAAAYKAIRRRAAELKQGGQAIDDYPRRPSKRCETCPFAIQCVGDMHALPFAEMSVAQLIETSYLAAAVEAQCKEIIKTHLIDTHQTCAYANGQGYELGVTVAMRAAKQKGN